MSVETPITIVVPLGGIGSRFQNEGHFARPKPFVRVFGKDMILWVLDNLSFGQNDNLVIAFNPSWMCLSNWMREVVGSRSTRTHLVELPGPTKGAAETVLIALRGVPQEVRDRPVMLCDGDTFYTYDIVSKFREVAKSHNASFVFHDTQPKPIYSYCTVNEKFEILETREKVKISDWANSGCYCFRSGTELEKECDALLSAGQTQLSQDKAPEYYTSGVIARMLARGAPFKALEVPVTDINVLGTPAQVERWCQGRPSPKAASFAFSFTALRRPSGQAVEDVAAFAKSVFGMGHYVSVLTPPSLAKAEVERWLKEQGVGYHALDVGGEKDSDFLIRRDAVDPLLGDLAKQTGFYNGVALSPERSATLSRTRGVSSKSAVGAPSAAVFVLGLVTGLVLASMRSRQQ